VGHTEMAKQMMRNWWFTFLSVVILSQAPSFETIRDYILFSSECSPLKEYHASSKILGPKTSAFSEF